MPPGEFKKRAVLAIFPLELLFRIDVMTDAHIPRAHESLIHPNFVFIVYFFQWRWEGDEGRTAGHGAESQGACFIEMKHEMRVVWNWAFAWWNS